MPAPQPLMAGKRGLIMGVANDRSLAWGIAQACADHGAELAFTYQGDALAKRVKLLAASVNRSFASASLLANGFSILFILTAGYLIVELPV